MTEATTCSVPRLDWVRAAQGGDREAFSRLVDATRSVVCSITLAIVGDKARSEDVAQEVLLAAWRGLPTLRNPASFLPWLRQLARNRAHESLRQLARYRGLHGADLSPAVAATVADPRAAAEEVLGRREDDALLSEGLAALPDDAREVLTLYYREGRSVEQVAALLGLGTVAVKKRLQRARDGLRVEVLERMGEIARRTAPGAAFSAAIMGSIGLTAPATAAAAGVGTAAQAGGLWKLLVGGVAMLPSLVAGLAAIHLPLRSLARRAIDERERRQLRTLGVLSSLSLVAFVAGVQVSVTTERSTGVIAGYCVMQATFIVLYGFWLPRIQRRRQAVERAADPTTVRRHRRERFWGLFGLAIGSTTGLVTVYQVVSRLF